MKYDFNESLEKDEKEFGTGGGADYFNVEEGNGNVIRVLSPGAVYGLHFLGKGVKPATCYGKDAGCPIKDEDGKFHANPSPRYAVYVLDRSDEKVKVAFFPYTVIKQIGVLQTNPDYAFEDLPMPYDIRITYKAAESPANKYKVDVKPTSAEPTAEQIAEYVKRSNEKNPTAIVERMKEKQMKADIENGRILTPDKLADEQKARDEEWNQDVEAHNANVAKEKQPVIEYPEEDIKADDILF